MFAFTIDKPGSPLDLKWNQVKKPEVGKGQVLIKVSHVSLNPVDFKLIQNGHAKWKYPHIVGVDAAGMVEDVGQDVDFSPGQRVACHVDLRYPGTFGQYVVTSAHTVARVPDEIGLEKAAALPCAGMTAYQALKRLGLLQEKPKWVLINGASGGVGIFACQLAILHGHKVIGTASPPNHSFLESLGVIPLDYKDPDLVKKIVEISDGGVNAVIEAANQATLLLDVCKFGSGMACILSPPDMESWKSHPKKPSLHPIALGMAHAYGDFEAQLELKLMLESLLELVKMDKLDPMEKVYPRNDLPIQLDRLQKGGVRGKLVIDMK